MSEKKDCQCVFSVVVACLPFNVNMNSEHALLFMLSPMLDTLMYRLRFDYVNIKIINIIFFSLHCHDFGWHYCYCCCCCCCWLAFDYSLLCFPLFNGLVRVFVFIFTLNSEYTPNQLCLLPSRTIYILLSCWLLHKRIDDDSHLCLCPLLSVKQMRICHMVLMLAKMRCTNNPCDSGTVRVLLVFYFILFCFFFHHERTFLFKFNLAVLLQILWCCSLFT